MDFGLESGHPEVYSNDSPGARVGCSPTTPSPFTSCTWLLASVMIQWRLINCAATLRVFVTASHETRVRRVVKSASITEKDAKAVVEKTDADRREFFGTFFQLGEERPTLYDLVVNTDTVSVAGATRAILAASSDA